MRIKSILNDAGITLNGPNPQDPHLKWKAYPLIFFKGVYGAGVAYMKGYWECEALDQLFFTLLRQNISPPFSVYNYIKSHLSNPSREHAYAIGEKHYDRELKLFQGMLDKRLVYSCGYWKDAATLDQAQENKLELIAKKIDLKEGMRVLDIGCGFGGFAGYLWEKYQISVTGITVSKNQMNYAQERYPNQTFKLMDWREAEGKYDRIVSIGQFEHVGPKNYNDYFKKMKSLLNPDGLFLLHTISTIKTGYYTDPWIDKFIFPNSFIPSFQQILKESAPYFVLEDLHNFGADYDKTLMAWYENFEKTWPEKNSEFFRMWKYYLLSCAGAFRARNLQLGQFVFSHNGILGGYISIR